MKILFVCMGNICRSPALEAALQKLLRDEGMREVEVASCGLRALFEGQQADERMRAAAKKWGIEISGRARLFKQEDFHTFDLILAVDRLVEAALQELAPDDVAKKKIVLATHFSARYLDEEMKDPYRTGASGFDKTIEMALDACTGLIKHLKR
jgi:protein-tyrosine phosphatase